MTSEQIKLVKDICLTDDGTGNPKAGVFTVLFNDEISFRNTDDFVIWDDANELIHKITINFDGPVSGAAWPYKISTGFFGNIQFLEGLYNMSNFEKVVDEMFLNKGLIDKEKKEMIMKWAANIRNHAMVPQHPGPYYPTVPQIPPCPPRPECRPDGIFHGAPIDQRTKKNLIFKIVDALIAASTDFEFKKIRPMTYEVLTYDLELFANQIKAFIEGMGKDLFYASYTDNDTAAIYNPKKQESIDNFVQNAIELVLPQKKGVTKNTILYIEAYGVRVRYDFMVDYENDDAADEEWKTNTTESVVNFVESINNPAIDSVVINDDYSFSAVINTTDGLDIGLTEFLASLPDTSKVIYSANGVSYVLTVGDESTYDTFKKGVIDSMPTENGAVTVGNTVITSTNAVDLVYTMQVKYFNEAEAVAKIGDQYYSVLANALAAATSGQTVELLKDIEVSNDAVEGTSDTPVYVIPDGVTFNGGNHTMTAKSEGWVSKGGSYGDNHILGVTAGSASILNLNLVGHAAMKSGIVVWKGASATIDTVDIKNCGNCGIQAAGGTVVLTNYTSSGNVWGSVNADMGGGVAPSVTFNSGTMSDKVEIYTEITDQEVVTAPSLTKVQGFGTQLKGFIYYTSDVTKLGAYVIGDKVYETIADITANADNVTITLADNTTESITIPEGKTFTLDMAGHTLTNAADVDTIVNNGTLIINGTGTIDNVSNDKAPIINNGTLTLLKGTITRSAEAGVGGNDDGGNSYYTILNHGDMTIGVADGDNSGIAVTAMGGHSSLISNGWYDSTGKTAENDTCTMTINGGTFTGGKYCFKNDELGEVAINGGTYTGCTDNTLLNWHKMTINDGSFTATKAAVPNVLNGTYQQGVGHLEIAGGEFTAANGANVGMINGYTSSDITITGGTFSSKVGLSSYMPEGYEIDETSVPGKFVVVEKSSSETVDEEVNSFIDGLDAEGVTVEPVPDTPNTYTITTNGALTMDSLIDQVTGLENVTGVTVSDGTDTASYAPIGGDLAAFKSQVNAMLPTLNEDEMVTLTMTVSVG